MKNKAVKIGIIASLAPHLFCCVLPIVLSVVSLFAPEFAHTSILPAWIEPWLFVFSALMLGLSWVLVVRYCHCNCDHCHDDSLLRSFLPEQSGKGRNTCCCGIEAPGKHQGGVGVLDIKGDHQGTNGQDHGKDPGQP